MRKFIILTDSTSDLNKELRVKYDIDYVQMNITYDNKELPASLDWDYYTPKELYDIMRHGTRIMTTQVPAITFENVFRKYAEAECDVLYIACSSALSGSINTAKIISEQISEEYPECKIICVDSLISCLGEGLIAIKASELRSEGKTIEEVSEFIEKNRLKYNQVATVESLEYLKRAGRVKTSSAFFGNIFSVKPIIISDINGQNYAFKKVKGRRASLLELCELTKEYIVDPEKQSIFVCHADSLVDAQFVKEHLERDIPEADFHIDFIGPIIGASVGPGTIAVYFVGKEVTVSGQ